MSNSNINLCPPLLVRAVAFEKVMIPNLVVQVMCGLTCVLLHVAFPLQFWSYLDLVLCYRSLPIILSLVQLTYLNVSAEKLY